MFRSISSISFSGQLEDKIEAAARAGFDGIEVFREDIIGFDGPPEEIARFADGEGIGIVSLQSLRDFEGFEGPARDAAFGVPRGSLIWPNGSARRCLSFARIPTRSRARIAARSPPI